MVGLFRFLNFIGIKLWVRYWTPGGIGFIVYFFPFFLSHNLWIKKNFDVFSMHIKIYLKYKYLLRAQGLMNATCTQLF